MCGDGANDCGALKAAHTGISLSDAESSVASPFTSKNPNITCVPNIIKEGRAALVTSFGIFKYMASYSLCQFISVMILYSIDSNLTDIQYLYIDLFIISIFAFFFGRTESYSGKLVKETPLSSLISLSPILSLSLQLFLVGVFQVAAFEHVQTQDWFVPFNATAREEADSENVACLENYTVFAISSFQYVILAIVFSKGPPYRQSIFSNYGFMLSSIGLTAFSAYLILYPFEFLRTKFELIIPPVWDFRLYMLAYALVHFVLAILIEVFIIENLVFKKLRFKFHDIDKSRRKFLAIERDLHKDAKWPTLTSDFKSSASPQSLAETPKYTAEIVIENENTFDKNHVLNSFFDASRSSSTVQNATMDTTEMRLDPGSPTNTNTNTDNLKAKLAAASCEQLDANTDVLENKAVMPMTVVAKFMQKNNQTGALSCDELESGRALNRDVDRDRGTGKCLSGSAPNVSNINCFVQIQIEKNDNPNLNNSAAAVLEMNNIELR